MRKQRGGGECCAHCNEEVETITLVDGCQFSGKDGLDFTFIWSNASQHNKKNLLVSSNEFLSKIITFSLYTYSKLLKMCPKMAAESTLRGAKSRWLPQS